MCVIMDTKYGLITKIQRDFALKAKGASGLGDELSVRESSPLVRGGVVQFDIIWHFLIL